MTTLSQYLRAERVDTSEPASFYVPGLEEWGQRGALTHRVTHGTRSEVDGDPILDEVSFKIET